MQSLKRIPITINLVIAAVFAAIISFFLITPFERQFSEEYNLEVLKKNINLFFQVPSPGKLQIAELEKNAEIAGVFPYYDLFTDIQFPNQKTLHNFYSMLITNSQIETFPFIRDGMIIEKSMDRYDKPVAFIDYGVSKKYNLSLSENLEIPIGSKNLTLPVVGVINNTHKVMHVRQGDGTEGLIIIAVPNQILEELEQETGRTIQYGGAYIQAQNYIGAKKMLNDYKPLGRLKDQDLFNSQEAYSSYVSDFNKVSYKAEIRDLSEVYTGSMGFPFGVIPIALLTLLEIGVWLVLSFNNAQYKARAVESVEQGGKVGKILNSIKGFLISIMLVHILVYSLYFFALTRTDTMYCPIFSFVPAMILFFSLWIGALVILGKIYLTYYTSFLNNRLVKTNEISIRSK